MELFTKTKATVQLAFLGTSTIRLGAKIVGTTNIFIVYAVTILKWLFTLKKEVDFHIAYTNILFIYVQIIGSIQ